MGPGGPMGMGPRGMMGGPGSGQRMPGRPPPSGASPNPNSPATSLPMSSPGGGMMNSPHPMGSNPGTPVSGPPLSSPVIGKSSPGDGSSSQHGMSSQDMFPDPYNMPGNRMHNYKGTKEANLMPVPSPQQIQFPLLDGQELTIQKQPNTSLRDSDLVSPSVGGDPSTPAPSETKGPGTPAPQTPSSGQGEAPPKYPGPATPHTPGAASEGGMYPGAETPNTPGSETADKSSRFPAPSPSPADPRFPIPASPGQGRLPGGMSPSHMAGPGPAMGPDNSGNLPLNPGTPSSQNNNPNMSNKGFDPISSMAQMSQQLAGAGSTPCSTPNSIGPGPDSGLGSMGNLEPGMMNSPLGGSMLGPDGNPVFSSSGLTPGHDSSPTSMGPEGAGP